MSSRPKSSARRSTKKQGAAGVAARHPRRDVENRDSGRTVLLSVSGMSPAILTETVWALAHEKPRVIPEEVVVLTTTKGARDIHTQILEPRREWGDASPWTTLRRKILGATAEADSRLQLATPRVIELPDSKSGVKRPAEDLRTPADNAAAADFILDEVRKLTENPDIRVVASIAGGRKTMGALLYAAMSLLGRETDRLTHVLVSEPFDQCREFFFPDQPTAEISWGEGRKLLSADARIDLADIPFVPLRNLFERDLARRPGSFAALVAAASKQLVLPPPGEVRVLTTEPKIMIDGTAVRFSPREHVLITLLARACVEGRPPFTDHTAAHASYQQLASQLCTASDPRSFHDWSHNIPKNSEPEDIRKMVNAIREKLKSAGSAGSALERCLVSRGCLGFQGPGTMTFVVE